MSARQSKRARFAHRQRWARAKRAELRRLFPALLWRWRTPIGGSTIDPPGGDFLKITLAQVRSDPSALRNFHSVIVDESTYIHPLRDDKD